VIVPGLAVSDDVVGIVTEHAEWNWFVSIRTP
jgi:exosome complex RNA-binding protein Rrp4